MMCIRREGVFVRKLGKVLYCPDFGGGVSALYLLEGISMCMCYDDE